MSDFLNVESADTGSGWSALINVAVEFGVSYLFGQSEKRKNEDLLKRMAKLDEEQAKKLKVLIQEAQTQTQKTQAIFDFLTEQDILSLEAQRKKERLLPLLGLGLGLILISIIFYKLKKQNG
jgi:hypothetical protein